MRTKLNLGQTAPHDEDCVQVTQKFDYMPKMRAEAQIFVEMLQRMFRSQKIQFKIEKCPHDFGSYLDVAIVYDDEDSAAEDMAFKIESGIPDKWDDIAKKKMIELERKEIKISEDDELLPGLSNGKETSLSLEEVAKREGFSDVEEMIIEKANEDVVPSCCTEGCEVEPDGKCQHGNSSILMVYGLI